MYVVRNRLSRLFVNARPRGWDGDVTESFANAKTFERLVDAREVQQGNPYFRDVYRVSWVLRWYCEGRAEEYRGNGLVESRNEATRYVSKAEALADLRDWELDGYQGDRSGFRVVRVLTKVR